jgi:amino acid adenylation domain-containing protein
VTTIDPQTLDATSAWPLVADLWRELLGSAPAGADEDFFAAGGDSIQAAALLSRVQARLGATVDLDSFMTRPTPGTLAAALARGRAPGAGPAAASDRPDEAGARCSYAQERFWFIDQASDSNVVSNVSWALRLHGPLDAPRLERALSGVVSRHDSLRARFDARDGQPVMLVAEAPAVGVERLEAEGPAQAAELAADAAHTPFDLTRGPLLRVQLIALGPEDHVLHFVAHHIVCDDWTKGVILSELGALYADPDAELEDAVQYRDYARWQRERLTEPVLAAELEHWQGQLAGVPAALELATDRPRPAAATLRGARLRTTVPIELADGLRELGRAEGATPFVTMLAAFAALLRRYSGQEDFVVGTAIDNRGRLELESAVGLYTNVLALRCELEGGASFRELLRRARARTLDAVAHQELPFDRLAASAGGRDASRHPVFQAFYEFIVPAPLSLELAGVDSEVFEVPKRTAEFDLGLYLDEQRGGLDAVWEYSTDLFERETVERLGRHFIALLRAVLAEPDRPVQELDLLAPDERESLIFAWNENGAPAQAEPFHLLFEAQARRAPDAPALVAAGHELSYAELDTRANQIADLLIEQGMGTGEVVGVALPRTPELVAAILGILKAGGAYLPLNPDHPAARAVTQLGTAGARLLISDRPLEGFAGTVLAVAADALSGRPSASPRRAGDPDGLAYVLYTSGSTGVPKGVAVTHRNLVNYTRDMIDRLGAGEGMHFGSVSAVSTDLGNTAIFPALAAGACLHLVPTEVATDAAAFADYVAGRPLDVLKVTPSHLSSLLDTAATPALLPRRVLVLGGEALTWELAGRVAVPGGPRVINHYGPTEATIGCCTFELAAGTRRPAGATVPIGRPITGDRAYVLDARLEPVPVGVPGELFIGGAGVARGYINAPDQTAERFLDDPFRPGERVYRTGDLARRLPDGTIEFLGRVDEQVKIRGYRVEPAEVQAVLQSQPGVRQAAVVATGEGDGKRLVAYVAGEEAPAPEALLATLGQALPAYMVPAAIVALPALPLTPNGKLDRAALPSPDPGPAASADGAGAEPMSEVEAQLAAIWSELLDCEVGAADNFFEIGGHSLLAIRLIARLRKELGAKLSLKALIDAPTVRELAARVAAAQAAAVPVRASEPEPQAAPERQAAPAIPRAPRDRPLRCSFVQEQLWLVDQLTPGSAAYNFSWPLRVSGPLDEAALRRAAAELVRRHEALRTRFAAHDGQPLQIVEQTAAVPFEVIDVSGHEEPEAAAQTIIDEQTRRPFDLAKGPLLRVVLLRLGTDDHVLQVVVHHIVFDGVSKVVLYRELGALYDAFAAGRTPELAEPALGYADYAEWQRTSLDDDTVARELEHWRERLAGMPAALELAFDRPRRPVASLRGARYRLPFPATLRGRLETLARGERSTFFTTVLAAFDVLLHRYGAGEDIVVGTPVDTRARTELEEIVGPFINTVVVRSDLSGSPSFRELLGRVQERTLEALEHQELPFERLVAALAPERDLSRHPIFQALLALNPPERALALQGTTVTELEPAWSAARVDLFLVLDDLPHGLEAIWEYSTDLFDAATIERMAAQFVALLEAIVADPATPIDELPLLGEDERADLVRRAAGAATQIPEVRLEQLVATQAAATPERVAVQASQGALTYVELEAQANRLAHRLRGVGVARGDLVAVCLPRSEQLLVALLGVLKAGAAYVPVDPSFPAARQAFMLEDAQARVVVSSSTVRAAQAHADGEVILLDDAAAEIAAEPSTPPALEAQAGPEDLAYVIYTSGSTGRPKGVEIQHRALVNFLTSMRERPGLSADDVLVAVTTLSFDIAGLELYLPLITGARVVVAGTEQASDPRELARLLDRSGATVMQATPSTWRMLLDAGWPGQPGLKALCGGEALPPALADELVARGLELWNMYGPTETTIWSAVARIADPGVPISLGEPIANTTLHVLDRHGVPTPVGVPGELHIGGAGLARGYRGRPELTAERFIADPFAGEPGSRLYRTGDLVRYRPDGSIQFLGRLDHQVKLRGYRIELGEIEATLEADATVAAAAAKVHAGAGTEPSLVAYVVAAGDAVDPEALRLRLARALPAYMVPGAIVAFDALPLTPNGKVDRAALPAPELSSEPVFTAPRTETESVVSGLFAEVLGCERVGAHDDFFALGGQSLLAARLMSRLEAKLDVALALRVLFEAPTVAGLAAEVDRTRASASSREDQPSAPSAPSPTRASFELPPLLPAERLRPASFAQERFWFIDQVTESSAAYNISWPLRLRGALDVAALERALSEVARRHEVLRAHFTVQDGRPMQAVAPAASLPLEFIDLDAHAEPDAELQRLVDERTQMPFALAEGPLIRCTLIRLGAEDHVLQIVVHHIVADGWSKVIFFRELAAVYGAVRENRPTGLAELPLQYADFGEWQRSWLRDARLEEELAWWSSELEGIPTGLELPADHPRPAVPANEGGWWRTRMPTELIERLEGLARREQATLFMVMLATFEVFLHRYSGQDEVVVGTPVDTRGRPELEALIGPFVNTVAIRGDLSAHPSFRVLLSDVRRRTLEVMEHQDAPFEQLVQRLAPDRDLSRHPLFQALLSLATPEPAVDLPGLEVTELETEKVASRVDLTLLLQPHGDGMDAVWEYNSELFELSTVQRFARHFLALLRSIVEDPDCGVDALELIGADERAELLGRVPAAAEPFPVFCLHERFAAQAKETPDAIAVSYEGATLSYRELDERANQLAHRLRALGVEAETLVGLCLPRSLDLVVAILAVLKAGGAYLPLDPEHPAERLGFVLEDSRAAVLVTQSELVDRLPAPAARLVCLDRDAPELERESREAPAVALTPDNLAYVIYTSGSTGRPKGVLVEHGNVARLFTATEPWFGFGTGDTWTLLHSYAFDFSVWELWGALLYGGRLVVVPAWTARAPEALAGLLADEAVTVFNATPSLFMAAMDELRAVSGALALRLVIFGGEALHTRRLAPWYETFGASGPQLVNMYGITETTVHVTYRPLDAEDAVRDGSPIGRPIPDLALYLLDDRLEPVPDGVAGELFVGGAGVARGYLNRPELTAARFVDSAFAGRLYRTGDRARRRAGDDLEFEGRLDDQVKIRGFRIELGEIQSLLAQDPAVTACTVVAHTSAAGDARLAAYLVAGDAGGEPAGLTAEVRERLRDRLPEYMVPASFTWLDALPLTANGKLDRRALPAPDFDVSDPQRVVEPRTATERVLAEVWAELLGLERVGVDQDFFELGGHSLLAAQLAARLRTRLERPVSVRAVFEHSTVAALASFLERDVPAAEAGAAAPAPELTPRGSGEAPALGYSQQQLWLLDQWDPGAPTYNVALPFRLRGPVNVEALGSAVGTLVARHEALRTVIEVHDDRPVARVLDAPDVSLDVIELIGASEEDVRERLAELARRPFDFTTDPLLRASLLVLGDGQSVLLLETHHMVFDGWSEGLLLRELAALYAGRDLPDPPLQFGDFALWQRRWLEGPAASAELTWWRRELAGAPTWIDLPADHPRPETRRFRGASHDLALGADTARALRELCHAENVTPYMAVLAGLCTILYRITGQDDILVGSPAANRGNEQLEHLIGFVSNTLVFRTRLSGNPSFRELVRRVRETALEVYAHQGVPFEKIVEAVAPDRRPGVNPLFQVNLRVSTAGRPVPELECLEVTPLKVDSGLARFDFALDLDVLDDDARGYLRFNADLFDADTIARFADELTTMLGQAVAHPDERLLDLALAHSWGGAAASPGRGLAGFRARARENRGGR